jgi:hypothetical protein
VTPLKLSLVILEDHDSFVVGEVPAVFPGGVVSLIGTGVMFFHLVVFPFA